MRNGWNPHKNSCEWVNWCLQWFPKRDRRRVVALYRPIFPTLTLKTIVQNIKTPQGEIKHSQDEVGRMLLNRMQSKRPSLAAVQFQPPVPGFQTDRPWRSDICPKIINHQVISIVFVDFRPKFVLVYMFAHKSLVIWLEIRFKFYLCHSSWAKVQLTMNAITKLLMWNLQNGTKTTFFYWALSQ